MSSSVILLTGTGGRQTVQLPFQGSKVYWQLQTTEGKPLERLPHYGRYAPGHKLEIPIFPAGFQFQLVVVEAA